MMEELTPEQIKELMKEADAAFTRAAEYVYGLLAYARTIDFPTADAVTMQNLSYIQQYLQVGYYLPAREGEDIKAMQGLLNGVAAAYVLGYLQGSKKPLTPTKKENLQ